MKTALLENFDNKPEYVLKKLTKRLTTRLVTRRGHAVQGRRNGCRLDDSA